MMIDQHEATVFTTHGRGRGALTAALAAAALLLGAAPAAAEPVFAAPSTPLDISIGNLPTGITVTNLFDDVGTNAKFTEAVFSTTEYYSRHEIQGEGAILLIEPKSHAELNALASPPPSPFQVTVDVTMTNDEDQTASGTVILETLYNRTASTPLPGAPAEEPYVSLTQTVAAPPGDTVTLSVEDVFDNAGTDPVFTSAEFHPAYLLHHSSGLGRAGVSDRMSVRALTADRLPSPPPAGPLLFKADVSMFNVEGQTASGTITFQTTYTEDESQEPTEDTGGGG